MSTQSASANYNHLQHGVRSLLLGFGWRANKFSKNLNKPTTTTTPWTHTRTKNHTRLLSALDRSTLKVHYLQSPAAMEQDLSNPSERNLTVNKQDIILYILRGNFTAGQAMSIFVKEKVIKCPLECPMSILLICPNVLYQVSDCIWIKLVYAFPSFKG